MSLPGRGASFTDRDLEAIRERGMSVEDALRQLARIREGSPVLGLDRPATVGDGIERAAGREAALEREGRSVADSGRCALFVPASGAATRMFQVLIQALGRGQNAGPARSLLEESPRFAFHAALAATLERQGLSLDRLRSEGDALPALSALLGADGLDYARLPKGLIPFHREGDDVRTALEEHLEDAAALGIPRLHFTVPPEHETRFATIAEERAARIERRGGARVRSRFSRQSPASDCVAATPEGAPFRDAEGRLLFRPGGHGALIANLAASEDDLVLLKNVDNVAAGHAKPPTYQWALRVFGRLAELEREAAGLLARLEDPADAGAPEEARRFAARAFHRTEPVAGADPRADARALLDRPLRVCGMVPNTGEPGGGPFWVRDHGGNLGLQIVEAAQMSHRQRGIFARATHFNPVFMACALRDHRGRPHDLTRFVDEDAVIVTHKSQDGHGLVALERPGLWNGSMAKWNTVFLEVPAETFTPVKTVFDLLRPEHQPSAPSSPGR